MADSFAINQVRIKQTQDHFAKNIYMNRAFTLCTSNKETFENCYVKYVKGWNIYKEAFEEQFGKDQNKYRQYKKMEDKNEWLAQRQPKIGQY